MRKERLERLLQASNSNTLSTAGTTCRRCFVLLATNYAPLLPSKCNKLHIDTARAAVYLRQALLLPLLVASSNVLPIQTAAALRAVNSSVQGQSE